MNARVVGTISQVNPNPSSSFVTPPNTTGAIAAGDKVIAILDLRNSNPTGISFSVGGHAFTEDTAARSTRTDSLVVMYWDADVAVASGAAVTGSWTNTGTQDGGGAQAQIVAITPDAGTVFSPGAAPARGIANGLSINPRIPAGAATVTPPSATAKYLALSAFIISSGGLAADAVTPPSGWTGFPVVNEATRQVSIWTGYQEIAAPAAALAAAWTSPSRNWAGTLILVEQPSAAAPTNTAVPTVTGTAAVGQTLTTTTGSWTSSPSSYSYQWYRDLGTNGSVLEPIAGATSSSYTVPGGVQGLDLGSKLLVKVTATNASGASAPAASALTATVPAPAGQITARLVVDPTAGTDHEVRTFSLQRPVLPGDKLVLFVACSNANLIDGNGNKQDVGYILDSLGQTWTERLELAGTSSGDSANTQHSAQMFDAVSAAGMARGAVFTMNVHTIGSVPGTDGDPLGYHGNSPYWYVVAISTGDSRTLTLDAAAKSLTGAVTTHPGPSVSTTNPDSVLLSFHTMSVPDPSVAGWWTPDAAFTELVDTPMAKGNGGETAYAISGAAKVVSSGFSGVAGASSRDSGYVSNLLAAYGAAAAGGGGGGVLKRTMRMSRIASLRL